MNGWQAAKPCQHPRQRPDWFGALSFLPGKKRYRNRRRASQGLWCMKAVWTRVLQQQRVDQPAALPEHHQARQPDHARGIAEDTVLALHPRLQIAVEDGNVNAVLQRHEARVLDEVRVVVADPNQREQKMRVARQQVENGQLHVSSPASSAAAGNSRVSAQPRRLSARRRKR